MGEPTVRVEVSAQHLVGHVFVSRLDKDASLVLIGCSAQGVVDDEAHHMVRGRTVTAVTFEHVSPDDVRRSSPALWAALKNAMVTTTRRLEDA